MSNREDDEDLEDLDPDEDLNPDDLDLDDFILDDEGFDFKEDFGLPGRLPPVRLPPEQELAAMSRTAPLLGRARKLAAWVAPGRRVTDDAELDAEDTVAAARELGIAVPVKAGAAPGALPGMPDQPTVAGMQDVPELARLWDIAFDAGFLELDFDGDRMEPGEDMDCWPGGTDEEVLDVWSTTLSCVVNRLEDDAELDDRLDELLDFTDAGWALMVMLFLAKGEGVPVSEASEMIRQGAVDELAPDQAEEAWQAWTRAHGDPAQYLLGMLQELSAVSLLDQQPGESGEGGPVARLTPLGTWAMREMLVEDGVEIPMLRPFDQMTADDLVAAAQDLDEEDFEAETGAWLELRAPETAARELLAVAADGRAAERLLAVAAVQKLGGAAGPAWQDSLGRPELRPYAKIALSEIAGGEPEVAMPTGLERDLADLAWLLTDTLAAVSDTPDALQQQIRDAIPPGHEQQMFDTMSLLPHPDAAMVLSLIGRIHPDKLIAKAARRSAHRAASRPKPAGQKQAR